MAAAVQQAAGEQQGDAPEQALFAPLEVRHQLLPLLLPGAAAHPLDYAAAMVQPFAGSSSSSDEQQDLCSLEELAAAAAQCAVAERSVQQLGPAAEGLRPLRDLAVALSSRSLDLAAAFAAADGQQLALDELVRWGMSQSEAVAAGC